MVSKRLQCCYLWPPAEIFAQNVYYGHLIATIVGSVAQHFSRKCSVRKTEQLLIYPSIVTNCKMWPKYFISCPQIVDLFSSKYNERRDDMPCCTTTSNNSYLLFLSWCLIPYFLLPFLSNNLGRTWFQGYARFIHVVYGFWMIIKPILFKHFFKQIKIMITVFWVDSTYSYSSSGISAVEAYRRVSLFAFKPPSIADGHRFLSFDLRGLAGSHSHLNFDLRGPAISGCHSFWASIWECWLLT